MKDLKKILITVSVILATCVSISVSVCAQIQKPILSNHELTKAKKTAIDFLNWYVSNFDRLQKVQEQLISGTLGDSTKPYRVNFEAAGVFLKELNKSGYVSEIYLEKFRRQFSSVNEDLIKSPQWDGPILGFQLDLIFNVMETDDITKHLKNLKTVYQFGDVGRALVIYRIGKDLHLIFNLTKWQGKWLITDFEAKYI